MKRFLLGIFLIGTNVLAAPPCAPPPADFGTVVPGHTKWAATANGMYAHWDCDSFGDAGSVRRTRAYAFCGWGQCAQDLAMYAVTQANAADRQAFFNDTWAKLPTATCDAPPVGAEAICNDLKWSMQNLPMGDPVQPVQPTYTVAKNPGYPDRPVYPFDGTSRGKTAIKGVRAVFGAPCDCAKVGITEGASTYCSVLGRNDAVALCVKP